jgi:hypothetical protein
MRDRTRASHASDLVFLGRAYELPLTILCGFDTKRSLSTHRKLGDGNQVDTSRLGAVDAKEVDLALIVTLGDSGISVMGVVAANTPADSSVAKPARLALNL